MSFTTIKLENSSIHVMTSNSPSHTLSTTASSVKFQPMLAKKSSPTTSASLMEGHHSPTSNSSINKSLSSPELLRCKRRINFGGLSYGLPQTQPATVARRNERERNRVKMVNMGFHTLRQHVPNGAKNKKMSKVETLRSAVDYIRELRQLLGETDDQNGSENSSDVLQIQCHSSDENWNPSPTTSTTSTAFTSLSSLSYACSSTPVNSSIAARKVPNSPSSPILTTSPSPSMGSDASSPYESIDSMERQVSPEDEELFDFTTWFS